MNGAQNYLTGINAEFIHGSNIGSKDSKVTRKYGIPKRRIPHTYETNNNSIRRQFRVGSQNTVLFKSWRCCLWLSDAVQPCAAVLAPNRECACRQAGKQLRVDEVTTRRPADRQSHGGVAVAPFHTLDQASQQTGPTGQLWHFVFEYRITRSHGWNVHSPTRWSSIHQLPVSYMHIVAVVKIRMPYQTPQNKPKSPLLETNITEIQIQRAQILDIDTLHGQKYPQLTTVHRSNSCGKKTC